MVNTLWIWGESILRRVTNREYCDCVAQPAGKHGSCWSWELQAHANPYISHVRSATYGEAGKFL